MKKILYKYKFISIFMFIMILTIFFPLTGKDQYFAMMNINYFRNFIDFKNGGIVLGTILTVLAKMPVFKILVISVLSTSMFILLKNIVSKKNSVLAFLGVFLFFLIDKKLFASSFVNLNGFVNHFIGSLFILIMLNIFNKNALYNMREGLVLILGFLGTCLNPVYAFSIFLLSILYIIFERRVGVERKYFALLSGEILGILLIALNLDLNYVGFSHNIIREFIPRLVNMNFIIVLILNSLVLLESFKIFSKKNKVKIVLSAFSMLIFLFSTLLIKNPLINYITFIANIIGSLFILINLNNSDMFKRKMCLIYCTKIIYILCLCFLGNIEDGNILFLTIIDILIILELYNSLLPTDFLLPVWILVSVFSISSNIYIYKSVNHKYEEYNFYMKNTLECSIGEHKVPSKYLTEYLYDYIPQDTNALKWYVEYHDINPLSSVQESKFYFK